MNDKRMGMRLKAKVYRLVVRPVLTYGAECWALNKRDEKRLEVTEMNMLRRMLGVTRRDRLRNEEVRERTGMQENIVKVVERSKMRWLWACGEEGRGGCGEKSNGLPNDGEKK